MGRSEDSLSVGSLLPPREIRTESVSSGSSAAASLGGATLKALSSILAKILDTA